MPPAGIAQIIFMIPVCNSTDSFIFATHEFGPVAEWLGRALQKLLQRFESARDLLTRKGQQCSFLLLYSSKKIDHQ